MPIRKPQGDPQRLLEIARSGARRLSIDERQHVLFWMKLEGEVFTTRRAAELFGVSHQQIAKDLREVDERLTAYHRENGRDADRLVAEYGLRFERGIRALWRAYEDATDPSDKAGIVAKILEASDRHLDRMQELGIVPRAPRRLEAGAVLLTLPEVSELARDILQAAARVGVTGAQMEAFRRELATALRAGKHGEAVVGAPEGPYPALPSGGSE